MKNRIIRAWKKGMVILAAAGFFGLLYPDLCMLEDTCRLVYLTDGGEEKEISIQKDSELYYKLLSAEPEEIKIKSRLWEIISNLFEKDECEESK